jgi:hypothetical protein
MLVDGQFCLQGAVVSSPVAQISSSCARELNCEIRLALQTQRKVAAADSCKWHSDV